MAPLDPRDLDDEQIGTKLRDAAVDPESTDFLPPVNAGEEGELGNPHGPHVVAPGLHGVQGVRPIRPGPVSDTPSEQSQDETEHTLVWQPETDPVEQLAIAGDDTVEAGDTLTLVAEATRVNSGETDVTEAAEWSTSDAAKATVAAGVVTGVAAGTATITAEYGGETAELEVTVTAAG